MWVAVTDDEDSAHEMYCVVESETEGGYHKASVKVQLHG
jgi:hypothetical protein